MLKIIRLLGSLSLAVTLIGVLMLTLIVSTVTESFHGTPFVQVHFYNTRWFDALLGLFAINIFCATLTRWPFRKRHIGFVITHIGILLVLTGSLLTRISGAEGQMTLFEGQKKSWILREGFILQIWQNNLPPHAIPLKSKALDKPVSIPLLDEKTQLSIVEVRQDAKPVKVLTEGAAQAPDNRAIDVSLSSEIAGLKERFHLSEKDPEDPHSFFKDIGPAHVELEAHAAEDTSIASTLVITQKNTSKRFTVNLDSSTPEFIDLKYGGLKINGLHYYPNARVVGKKLVNMPEAVAFNPAVEFEISDAKNHVEKHTKFFLFPGFDSLKGGPGADVLGLDVSLDSKVPSSLRSTKQPALIFMCSPEGKWSYQIRSSKKSSGVTPLKLREKIPTGWMDIAFEAHETYLRAEITTQMQSGPKDPEKIAVRLSNGAWAFIDKPVVLETAKGPVKISIEPASRPLPFSLALKDFRKVDYPGTENAASYESDVSLHDDAESVTIEKTISMNKPLDYKGWRIFQASYILDPELGEASVFSIAKNPGIPFIYTGSLVILLGVILLFYFHPFFSGKKKT